MQMVRKCKDEDIDWDTALPYFLFACRDAVSSSTGFTPVELLYGKNVHGPLDVLRNQWVPTSKTPKSAIDWITDRKEMIQTMHYVAIGNEQEAKDYSKHRNDVKARNRDFPKGIKVLVFAPIVTGTRSDKLADRWQGPFTILGKVTPVTYLVDMPECH